MSDTDEKLASWFLAFAAAIFCVAVLALHTLSDRRPNVPPARTVTVCSGCGSEWSLVSPADGTMEPITTCPNCPLSEDEWERLKKQVRGRKAGGGE